MTQRIGKKSAKMNRMKGKKGKMGAMPNMDEMKAGMAMTEEVAAKQRKRGAKKRRKAKGRY